MKIAMLSEGRYPLIGGGQLYAQYLSANLIKNYDCEIDIFTRSFVLEDGSIHNKNETIAGSKQRIFRIGPTKPFFNPISRIIRLFKATFFLYRKARSEKYDIIHAHALIPGLPAKIVGNLLKIPVVYTVHGTMHMDTEKKGLLYRGEKFFTTKLRYDLEISVSHKILSYKNVNKNIKIIHPAVDPKRFDIGKEIRKYPGVNFLFVGRLDWQKGLEFLLEGISNIDRTFLKERQFHLNIVGNGLLWGKLNKLIKEYKIEEFVSMKGELFGEPLIKEYLSNQIFVLPSLAEGQPVVLFEAFLSKMPVIVTDVGDNKYFVKNGENGFIIPSGDSSKIKESIVNMLQFGKSDYEKMGETNYNKAMSDCTRDILTQNIYNEYKNLLSKRK